MYQTFLGETFSSENLAANTPRVWFCLDFLSSLELELASDLPTANTSLGTLCVDELLSVTWPKTHSLIKLYTS